VGGPEGTGQVGQAAEGRTMRPLAFDWEDGDEDVVFLCRETARTRSRPVMAVRRIFGRLLSSMAARGAARRM